MDFRDILIDAYGRVREVVHMATDGLDRDALWYRPEPGANSIAWLIWHLTRIQDHHVSQLAGRDQAWVAGGWAERFGMEPDPEDHGYGHTADQVAAIRPDGAEVLTSYHDTVSARTAAFVEGLTAADLERIVDRSYDPPVTMAVRLVSVVSDNLQHGGQARYLRGMIERIGTTALTGDRSGDHA